MYQKNRAAIRDETLFPVSSRAKRYDATEVKYHGAKVAVNKKLNSRINNIKVVSIYIIPTILFFQSGKAYSEEYSQYQASASSFISQENASVEEIANAYLAFSDLVESQAKLDKRLKYFSAFSSKSRLSSSNKVFVNYARKSKAVLDVVNDVKIVKYLNVANKLLVVGKTIEEFTQVLNGSDTSALRYLDIAIEFSNLEPTGIVSLMAGSTYSKIKSIESAMDQIRDNKAAGDQSYFDLVDYLLDVSTVASIVSRLGTEKIDSDESLAKTHSEAKTFYEKQISSAIALINNEIAALEKEIKGGYICLALCKAENDAIRSRILAFKVQIGRLEQRIGEKSDDIISDVIISSMVRDIDNEIRAVSKTANNAAEKLDPITNYDTIKIGEETPISLSGNVTDSSLETFYAAAPDLTTDTQDQLVTDANPNTPVDPPVVATSWAGRMTLSGRVTSGSNPATGVVDAMDASGNAPISDFILFNPGAGSLSTPIHGTQSNATGAHSFSHLIWGDWVGGNRTWTTSGYAVNDLSGFFVYGELTPVTARTSGSATYTGRLRGDVIEEGGVIQRGLAYGDFGLTANFGTGTLGGWLAISGDYYDSTNYVFVSDIDNAHIVRQSDNLHFYGDLGTSMADVSGRIEGSFYGPNATELGGTYEVTNTNGQGSSHGILLGWETGSMPTKPAFADGSKRAHISTQMSNGYVLDSSLSIITVPVQGQPSVTLAVPQEQGGGTVSTSQVYAKNGYSYTSWGKWTANGTTPDTYSSGGYWAAGDATPSSVMQNKTGSAVYNGEIIGDHVSNGVRQAAQGSVHLTADFNADRISGNMEFHTATTSMTPAPIEAPIQNSGYFGQISSDAANGNFGYGIQGNFFGPNADEVGGSAWASTSEGTYNGVFRAKQ